MCFSWFFADVDPLQYCLVLEDLPPGTERRPLRGYHRGGLHQVIVYLEPDPLRSHTGRHSPPRPPGKTLPCFVLTKAGVPLTFIDWLYEQGQVQRMPNQIKSDQIS